MDNQYTGEVTIDIGGKPYKLMLDWRAIASIKTKLGDEGLIKLMQKDPDQLATILAIGLQKHHPEMTIDAIMDASPPLFKAAEAINKALEYAYFGPEGTPKEPTESKPDEEKKTK